MKNNRIEHCMVLLESAIGTPKSIKVESFCDADLVLVIWDYLKDQFGIETFNLEAQKPGNYKVEHMNRILRILINLHGPKYPIREARSDIQKLLLYFIICRKLVSSLGNQHEESYFDLQTQILGLMTNLVENSLEEAKRLVSVSKLNF